MTPLVVLLCWVVCAVAPAYPKVVQQADGIISIITELEPEKIPVSYLQAVETPLGGGASTESRNQHDEQPVRVRSAKIRVVDPETGFKVVHHGVVTEENENKNKAENSTKESERRVARQPEYPSSYKVIYPSVIPEYFSGNEDRNRNSFQGRRKEGRYGYQTPRRDNTVRTEQMTRIRNNDDPAKIYKHTVVRPVTKDDEARQKTKYGKAGRYGKYAKKRGPVVVSSEIGDNSDNFGREHSSSRSKIGRPGKYIQRGPIVNAGPGVGEVVESSSYENEYPPYNNPDKRKTEKEYSSKTMVRFPDGYAQDNEKRVESSSRYRTGSSYKTPAEKSTKRNHQHRIVENKYPKEESSENVELDRPAITNPVNRKYDGRQVPDIDISENSKVESDQPLQEAGSVLGTGIIDGVDDGLIEDGGVIYSGGGYGGGYGGGFDKEKHFEKEKGKEYVAAHDSSHGAKGEKGYSKKEAFSKGENEKHGHEENKAYAKEKEGDEKSHLDKSTHYSAGHKAAEGAKETDYHREKGHRKGHKKSGFRTVHHKDEFKKNEEFFDEEHDTGGHQEHGHKAKEHKEKTGGHDKKAYLDSGHHHSSRGHEGGHENGNKYNQHKGHHQEKGHSGHYGHEQEYGKKSGFKEGEQHGHSEYGDHKHY